jgi:hypothetical protein
VILDDFYESNTSNCLIWTENKGLLSPEQSKTKDLGILHYNTRRLVEHPPAAGMVRFLLILNNSFTTEILVAEQSTAK